ncbi:hypothetical protein NUW58_g8951 [Xylaria curta]|uniref:Uncharacterized protein n=1 Tax=Xylaria curta TaxID=42375 RepID=A0ACC1N282_9PEZI|nr:hypothetical protein NUW58_g8951 [Xylaria curta]
MPASKETRIASLLTPNSGRFQNTFVVPAYLTGPPSALPYTPSPTIPPSSRVLLRRSSRGVQRQDPALEEPLPPNAVKFWTPDQNAYLADLVAQRISWVARTTLFQENFGLNRKTQSLKDRFLRLGLGLRSQIELEWMPTEETFLRSSMSSQLDMFHHFDIDEICRSFWAKFGQSRNQTSITMKIKKMRKKEQRQEPPRLKKLWSEAEDDFLRNWSGSRPDATAALNAKFGMQRIARSVVVRILSLKRKRA